MHVETNVRSKWGSHRSNLSLQLSSKNPTKLTKMTNSTLQPCRTAFHYRLPISRNNLRISDYHPSISGDNDTTIRPKGGVVKRYRRLQGFVKDLENRQMFSRETMMGENGKWYFGTTWKTHGLTLGKADRLTVNESESCQIGLTSDLSWWWKPGLHCIKNHNQYIIYIYMCIDRYMRTYIHIYIYQENKGGLGPHSKPRDSS